MDLWGAALICFLAADADEPGARPLDEGRAYTMSGLFAEGLELLRPLEDESLGGHPGGSHGRAGYAAFRLRRFPEAVRLWTPAAAAHRIRPCAEGCCGRKLRATYGTWLEEAKALVAR